MLFLHLVCLIIAASQQVPQQSPKFLNSTIWQALRQISRRTDDPSFIGMAVALQSPCNAALRRRLDDPNETFTVFAPVNEAFISFDPDNRMPLRMIGCGVRNATCEAGALHPFPGARFSLQSLQSCMPELTQYHVVPGIQFVALESLGDANEAIAVLPTALNSSQLVRLAPAEPQHIVVNQTATGDRVQHWVNGAATRPPARLVIRNIQCSNGVIHGIDRLLFPPANALRTLQAIDPRPAALALRTPELARPVTQQRNVTVFWPASGWQLEAPSEAVMRSMSRLWNYTDYIVQDQVIFNNSTRADGNLTVTMISGKQRVISLNGNYSMNVDDIPVVRSNVLLDNGVLHFIERPFETNTTSSL